MHKGKLFASTALGFALGVVLLNIAPALADVPVIDPASAQGDPLRSGYFFDS